MLQVKGGSCGLGWVRDEGGGKPKTGMEEEENDIIKIPLAIDKSYLRDQSLFLVNAKFWEVILLQFSATPFLSFPSFSSYSTFLFAIPAYNNLLLVTLKLLFQNTGVNHNFENNSLELQISMGMCEGKVKAVLVLS
jgi:hypothetical protein